MAMRLATVKNVDGKIIVFIILLSLNDITVKTISIGLTPGCASKR